MSNKVTKAFAFFTGLTRGANKPSAAPPRASAMRPATNAALNDLLRRKGVEAMGAAALENGAARRRLPARDLPRAGAAARARAETIATAREVARIRALPSPALPLDLQMRFDALKAASKPKPAQGGASLKRANAKVEAPKPEAPKPEAPKPEAPKPEAPIEPIKPERDDAKALTHLAGQVSGHVGALQHALAAPPSEQEQLLRQEIAALHELAMLISQILKRLTQRAGEAMLSITRN